MSGNINDTNTNKVNFQVKELLQELDEILKNNESIDFYESIDSSNLKNKYNYLWSTSQTLYNYILRQYGKPNFDKEFFYRNLNMMLHSIENIQKSKVSQYDASVSVGKELASQYIPNLKN